MPKKKKDKFCDGGIIDGTGFLSNFRFVGLRESTGEKEAIEIPRVYIPDTESFDLNCDIKFSLQRKESINIFKRIFILFGVFKIAFKQTLQMNREWGFLLKNINKSIKKEKKNARRKKFRNGN